MQRFVLDGSVPLMEAAVESAQLLQNSRLHKQLFAQSLEGPGMKRRKLLKMEITKEGIVLLI